jgi:hypothetical protein
MRTFQYEPLDGYCTTIRLVRLISGKNSPIRIDLIYTNLDENECIPYEALSYTWGPQDTRHTVYVDGQQLTVGWNLHIALLSLRSETIDRFLWIDAISVDINNIQERAHQIQQIGTIFQRATRVIFWLGEQTPETDVLFHLMKRLEKSAQRYPYKSWKRRIQIFSCNNARV